MSHTFKTCLCEGCKIYRKEKGLPEPLSAYDAEVRRVAQVLADAYNEHRTWSGKTEAKYKMDEARVMVAEMAKAVTEYANGLQKIAPLALPKEMLDNYTTAIFKVRGLIPSPENEQK